MKELSEKEIDRLIQLLQKIEEHVSENNDSWRDFESHKGLYISKIEILAMYKLYEELGIEIELNDLPIIGEPSEDFESIEVMYDLEMLMCKMLFPSEKVMKDNGWEETEILIDNEGIAIDTINNDEEALDSYYEECFGDFADVLTKPRLFFDYALSEYFWQNGAWTMKSTRAGKYFEYVNKHLPLKNTKLHKQIMYCVRVITQPFIFHYPDFDEMVVKNGCVYAFSTMGTFPDNESETVGPLQGNPGRYLCVEILNLLLTRAEEKYGYNKSDS